MNLFSIRPHRGAPALFKRDTPVFPLFFWQTELQERDAAAFSAAGIELFSFFRSIPHYEHPYFVAENRYDFSRFDEEIRRFHRRLPQAYCIPRIYVSAPEWWLRKHPEELCGFPGNPPRTWYRGNWQGTLHESFASQRWREEMGEAFRRLIRHLASADYAGCVAGVHVCSGITGEWHLWSPDLRPDDSMPMARRLGRPVPPPEKRGPGYYRVQQAATVEAIAHFCRIVKEESDFLTAVFYGYTPDMHNQVPWGIEGDHRAAGRLLREKSVDLLCAPHSYERRAIGQDGYFRNYPASIALHGKLFIDEGDDRTWLDGRESNGVEYVKADGTPADCEESLGVLRREFGNMLTHNIGMWFMDLNGGNFHDPRLMEEIARLKRWGDRSMALSRRRTAEVAVIVSTESEYHLPPRGHADNRGSAQLYLDQIGELCRCGVPFDLYLADDLASPRLRDYRIIVGLELRFLPRRRQRELAALLREGTRKFFCFRLPETPDALPELPPETTFLAPTVPAAELRALFTAAGAHACLASDDVLSASESAVIIHAASTGRKLLTLPVRRKITDLISGEIRTTDHLELSLRRGETRLFLLE